MGVTEEAAPRAADNDAASRSSGRAKLHQYLAAVSVCMASLVFGAFLAWSSPALIMLESVNSPMPWMKLTQAESSWLGSLLCVGALAAIPFYGPLQDRVGKKKAGYVLAAVFITSGVIIVLAKSAWLLLLARFLMGVSSCGVLVLCPTYIVDMTQDDIRGTLGSFFVMFNNVGILVTYILGAFFSYSTLNLAILVTPFLFIASYVFMPESPAFYISNGRLEEAAEALRWFRAGMDERDIEHELEGMTKLVTERTFSKDGVTFKDLVSSAVFRKGLIISLVLCANQQVSGVFVLLTFNATVFHDSGINMSPEAASILVGIVQVLGAYTATLLMDRAGRRFLSITSNIMLCFCLGTLSLYFMLEKQGFNVDTFRWLPVLCLCVHIFSYAAGVGPLPFVVFTEMFPPQAQSKVSTLCMFTIWGLAFVLTQSFATLQHLLGLHGVFGFFSVCCLLCGTFSYFYLIETKNKSVKAILRELAGEVIGNGSGSTVSVGKTDTTQV